MDTKFIHYPENGYFIHRYPGVWILKNEQNSLKCGNIFCNQREK